MMNEAHAGYKYLKTYKLSAVVYDLTVEFCERWIDRFSRTRDQMVQAARSGKQNIVEGSKGKSLQNYIRLCSVARASLEELLEDYHDFARQQGLRIWESREEREKRGIRDVRVDATSPALPATPALPEDKEKAVNFMVNLINQTTYLLDQQIRSLERKFIEQGGFTENLFRKRLDYRRSRT
jgi:four helix bundle suffix protein